MYEKEGKTVRCTDKTTITRRALDNSNYAAPVVINDQRGDRYYSRSLLCDIYGGSITKLYTTEEFYEYLKKKGKI